MTAIALAMVAGFGFGSAAIFARLGMQRAPPLAIIFFSLLFSFLLSIIVAAGFALSDFRTMPLVVLAWCLFLGALNFLGGRNFSYLAISRIGAARASAIVSTSTVFAAIVAITLTGERPHFVVVIGTLVVIAGLAAAMGRSIVEGGGVGKTALIGYLLAFGAAVCYGCTNVVAKYLTQEHTSPLVVSTSSLFFGFLMIAPVAARSAITTVRESRGSLGFVGYAALSGIAAAAAVNCLYFALQRSDVVVISPIVSANPLVTLLLASLFLAKLENVNRWLFLGVGVTVFGVVLVVVGSAL